MLLDMWSRSMLDKAEEVLTRMERAKVPANTVTYTTLIDGYVKATPQKLDKAEEVLTRIDGARQGACQHCDVQHPDRWLQKGSKQGHWFLRQDEVL